MCCCVCVYFFSSFLSSWLVIYLFRLKNSVVYANNSNSWYLIVFHWKPAFKFKRRVTHTYWSKSISCVFLRLSSCIMDQTKSTRNNNINLIHISVFSHFLSKSIPKNTHTQNSIINSFFYCFSIFGYFYRLALIWYIFSAFWCRARKVRISRVIAGRTQKMSRKQQQPKFNTSRLSLIHWLQMWYMEIR